MFPFVSEKSFDQGREFEARIVGLPKDVGVLFASVLPAPVKGGECRYFEVVVGISRNRVKETILPIIAALFSKEKSDGSFFSIEVVRGTSGAAANQALQGPPSSTV